MSGCDYCEDGEGARLIQCARDVETLDAWLVAKPGRWWDVDSDAPGISCVLHGQGIDEDWNYAGESPDAARHAAAEAIRKGEV